MGHLLGLGCRTGNIYNCTFGNDVGASHDRYGWCKSFAWDQFDNTTNDDRIDNNTVADCNADDE